MKLILLFALLGCAFAREQSYPYYHYNPYFHSYVLGVGDFGGGFDNHGNGGVHVTVPVGDRGAVSGQFGHSPAGNSYGVGGQVPVGKNGFVNGGVTHGPGGNGVSVGGGWRWIAVPQSMNLPAYSVLAVGDFGGGFDNHGNGGVHVTVPMGDRGAVSGQFGHSPAGNSYGVGGQVPVGKNGFVNGGVTHGPGGNGISVGGGWRWIAVPQNMILPAFSLPPSPTYSSSGGGAFDTHGNGAVGINVHGSDGSGFTGGYSHNPGGTGWNVGGTVPLGNGFTGSAGVSHNPAGNGYNVGAGFPVGNGNVGVTFGHGPGGNNYGIGGTWHF